MTELSPYDILCSIDSQGRENDMFNDQSPKNDFYKARRLGFWKRLIRHLFRESTELVDYKTLHDHIHVTSQRDCGVQTIPISKIVGSLGRHNEFDRNFMPVNETSEERWESVDAALLSGKDLPAIEVFKVGELYFVIDGNHRVSASRIQGIEYIDAHVIEVECNEDIRSTIEARALYLDTDDEDASSDE
jgi:uncharacterized ParB-like nuclease family protein